ncbi:hypothetical protein [Arthrobacter sp. NicSoilC5]|uniref:hypothetical protein n=1 Tax=Micrococcaceae TaxID=1268 RepID=UPI001CC59625|nr:hypothetical protein [Arthrobacter sp. NicSoilC5]BCW80278.1 hypothetical protein NicSoilC5_22970 [Arthrobacter sp. NicSoilC5]
MSNTRIKRPTRARLAMVPVLSLGLFGGFLALAAPANAETSRNGCTVDPKDPKDLRGNKVDFRIKVDCNGEKTVEIRQLRYEDDPGPRSSDDFLGRTVFTEQFDRHDGARTLSSIDRVPNLDRRGAEEVYQLVSFRVQNHGGHWSDWTPWEKSAVVEVHRDGK